MQTTHLADEKSGVETLRLVEDLLGILVVPEVDEGGSPRTLGCRVVDDAGVTDGSELLEAGVVNLVSV